MSKVTQFPVERMQQIPVNLPTGPDAPWSAVELAAYEAAKKKFAEYLPFFADRLILESEFVYYVVSAFRDALYPQPQIVETPHEGKGADTND